MKKRGKPYAQQVEERWNRISMNDEITIKYISTIVGYLMANHFIHIY